MSFASFPIESLGLKQEYANACARAGLSTASDVLLAVPADLAKKLRNASAAPVPIPNLVRAVSQAIAPQVHSAASFLLPPEGVEEGAVPAFISTGDAGLDAMLGGGVRVGGITEITGESAAGKSHLTLSLAVAAQLPPPLPYADTEDQPPPATPVSPGGTIILTSERILATSRLVELAEGMSAGVDRPAPIDEILDNIHTSRVVDIDALEHALAFAIPPMLAHRRPETYSPLLGERGAARKERPSKQGKGFKPIRLLIVDSITALLRGETERSSTSLTQRSRHLCIIADRLKALALEYELAVVVVNQVKDVFAPGFGVRAPITSNLPGVNTMNGAEGVTRLTGSLSAAPSSQASDVGTALPPMLYAIQARNFSGQSQGVAKEAALGIVWANAVNTRLMLARTGRRRAVSDDDLRGAKRARSAHPPQLPSSDRDDKELVRRFHLVFSPFAPPAMLDYVILGDGIRSLPASLRLVDLGPAIRRRDLRMRAAFEEPAEEMPAHLGSDIYDEMDIPPELWEGLDDDTEEEPPSPVAVGVVE
ncbi:hypothetical protein CcaverHIS002_0204410 [Cutaneotrichosporon cavernicola]|uniref:RecA family profile 1 domain-containing protein n=1 Tax=Cutaneotrichosporon cavernicola TaxID=279322 RepID=A0AA48KZW2_9TREE|nr:uncharacterized protein CcaverHIS019_0204380 [Cutaneotrichosporon cavernicola]BEI81281.1 hypothetical protein CcaverHIS002_0204410 [Cutaneotrichosporon cavernicola]BEI89076.1 hypothetical protein CcaverHIS019_0204380 [Cutaneotrichosporon cavernicola]BEI96852.1 hypothetical protein CcaverHIS631_0204410 [Cutaneotrichosporon cavernicola]BEJ04624.1 hypothetical protein CcaverHIS641_0204410 [Cutaneotrichosporon cavernicola]